MLALTLALAACGGDEGGGGGRDRKDTSGGSDTESPTAGCLDGVKNAGETDVDCGGPCKGCADGLTCLEDGDCVSQACGVGYVCIKRGCADGQQNFNETGVDCGGACGTCPSGQTCNATGQCTGSGTFPCKGPNEPSAATCGAVNDVGCCDASARVLYCMSGSLYCIDCANGGPSCGWKADASYYDCGTAGGAEPSGANPKACP